MAKAELTSEDLKRAQQYLGTIAAKSMFTLEDETLEHVAHALRCRTCDQHAEENLRLALKLRSLKAKNKKLRRRLKRVAKRRNGA